MRRVIALLLVISISGCGVPRTSKVIEISNSELPPELNEQSTTSTTSTTIAEEASAKETQQPANEVLSEPVELYYISDDRLVATTQSIVSPATVAQVLIALISGPPTGDNALGLRSALPDDLNAEIEISKGVAQINTTAEFLTELSPIDQRLAIAQLVLTFTRRPGVGQVIFAVDGQNVAVPRGRGDLAKPGSTVSFDDYSSLIVALAG
ncbi:MAG: GerMN domain-containing protein [Acidimicrobiaceae bacterium]